MPQSPSLPRKAPRQERSRATVAALVEAAARVLVTDGYEGMTTKRVAQVAGVSVGSLYQYFPSKQALVLAVAGRQTEKVVAACEAALQPREGDSVAAATRRLVGALLTTFAAEADVQRAVLEEVPRTGELRRISEAERRLEAVIRGFLAQHPAQVRPANLELAVFLIVRAVRAATWGAVVERPELLRSAEFLEELSTLAVGYLAGA